MILRALSFILLFQAVGVAIVVAVFGRRLASSLDSVRRLAAVRLRELIVPEPALTHAQQSARLSYRRTTESAGN